MAKIERFEDLTIWQEARELTKIIYEVTVKENVFRDFRFCGQLRSSSISIMNNTAEGFECKSDKKFANYLDIAKGSCGEVRSMLYVALDVSYIEIEEFDNLYNRTIKLSKSIQTLINYLEKPKNK